MKQSTLEWIEKAEGDWIMAQRAYRARKDPVYDAACFHSQQCVEKYLKAELNEAMMIFNKTHDLEDLLKQVLAVEPGQASLRPQAAFLTNFAVRYRYPGQTATKAQAQQALKDCREMRRVIRAAFGLPV
jgi:HEPN domain-containing protein